MPRLEWPTLALILACYAIWAAAAFWLWPDYPLAALTTMAVTAALHSSLVHECLHGHPTRNRLVNEALVAIPLSLVYPYRRYKATHLAHHHDERLTDPFEDPESYYKARWLHQRMPSWLQRVLVLNNTFIGRIVLGPLLGGAGFLASEARLIANGNERARLAWGLHLIALVPLVSALWLAGIPLWLYIVAVAWPSLSIISIRTFAEHRWHETPEGRTIIVERSPLSFLFLNNNLHIVHHRLPQAPWYELPRLYRERREEWQAMTDGYVFANYLGLFRLYALTPKEPVVHPVLQRFEPGANDTDGPAGSGSADRDVA